MGTGTASVPAQPNFRAGWGAMAMLALAAVTRVPLFGANLGEPDSARFLVGMQQWLRLGPHAPFVYGAEFSPLYYPVSAWLVQLTHARPLAVFDVLSLAAALAAAPLLYWIAVRLTTPAAAALGTALYLLAPAYWWLGIEPTPQQISFLFLLGALACVLRSQRPGWLALATAIYGIGLLFKNDIVVMGLVFPALAWRTGGADRWRRAAASLAIPVGGALIFLLGRGWILGQSLMAAQGQTTAAVDLFLEIPHGVEALKQVVPVVFGGGVATAALLAAGLALGTRDRAWRECWGWLLAAWVIPGVALFLLIRGNSARHMAPFYLLPLWAACETLIAGTAASPRVAARPAMAAAVLLAVTVGVNWAAVPANSNPGLFPSPNVFGSTRDLAARMRDLRGWFENVRADCFLGNGTLPYMEFYLLQAAPAATLQHPANRVRLDTDFTASADGVQFVEVNSAAQFKAAARLCGPRTGSLEYSPAGAHQRFLGSEWTWLPLASRWYH